MAKCASMLLYIQERRIKNTIKRLNKEVKVTIFTKRSIFSQMFDRVLNTLLSNKLQIQSSHIRNKTSGNT